MTPYTPASRIFIKSAGSFHVTRASGMTAVVEMAWSIVTAAWESMPWWAMTSAENALGIESHPLTTASPRLQICFTVLGLTVVVLPRGAPPRSYLYAHLDLVVANLGRLRAAVRGGERDEAMALE